MSAKMIGSLLSVALLAALTLGVFALTSDKPEHEGSTAADAHGNPNRPQTELLPVTLRSGGFVPREMSRPAGDYILSINNLSGVPELDLRLSREGGEKMSETKVLRRKPYWRQLMRLTPGTYLITEAGHPEWTCRLTVTAR